MFSNFKEVGIIGSGGFSKVFEIQENDGGQKYAKKVLLKTDIDNIRRFQREVRIMDSITHPNIVPIIAHNIQNAPYSYIMPLATGNLRRNIVNNPGIDNVWIFKEILKGMKAAHDLGYVHRDLKPENILFFQEDFDMRSICISDFGLGLILDRDTTTITSTNIGMGTILYCSPEQLHDSKNVDHLTDIFALGQIFYELLTGLPLPITNIEDVPIEYRGIVRKLVEPKKINRFQSIEEVINEIEFIEKINHQSPSSSIRDILESLANSEMIDITEIKLLIETFIAANKDKKIYLSILPNISENILFFMINEFPTDFETVFAQYDSYIDGNLDFSYCDTVAQFYKRVFDNCDSYQIRLQIVNRLPIMGQIHNRYYVGEVFGDILSKLDDINLINAAYTLLENNPDVAFFCQAFFCEKDIPSIFYDFCMDE